MYVMNSALDEGCDGIIFSSEDKITGVVQVIYFSRKQSFTPSLREYHQELARFFIIGAI